MRSGPGAFPGSVGGDQLPVGSVVMLIPSFASSLAHCALGATKWRIASIRIDVLPGTVVGRPEDVRVLVETKRPNLVHDPANSRVVFHDRVRIFGLRERLELEFGSRHVRLMCFMKLMLMKSGWVEFALRSR